MNTNITRFQCLTLSAALVACAGLLCARTSRAAATTSLQMQVSIDGLSWGNNVVVNPGTTVDIRAVVSFVANDTTRIPTGLASLNMQPTISNWTPQSQLRPFSNFGNNLNGGGVTFTNTLDGPYGRALPFAATGPTSSDPYIGHVQTVEGTSYLRIARSTITNWMGQGPTSGTHSANNFTSSGGIVMVQKNRDFRFPEDPPYSSQITNLVVFKFSVIVSSEDPFNQMVVDAPMAGLSRNLETGTRAATWDSHWFNETAFRADFTVSTATITQIPAPSTILVTLGAGSAFAVRRRRTR